jgi:hypothetical protein
MEQHQARRSELAAVFGYPGVAGAYRHRPPYPAEVFDVLERIITDRPRRVLDIGAGEGALARPLARRVDQVDAVETQPFPDRSTAGRGTAGDRGRAATTPTRFRQPVADYVEHFHSTSSLARELMTAGEAAAFDRAVTGLVRPHAVDGLLDLPVVADLAWGRITVTAGS